MNIDEILEILSDVYNAGHNYGTDDEKRTSEYLNRKLEEIEEALK